MAEPAHIPKAPARVPRGPPGPRPTLGRGFPRKARGLPGPQGRRQAAGTCTLSLAILSPSLAPELRGAKDERGQEEQVRGYLGLQLAWIRKKLRLLLNIWLES